MLNKKKLTKTYHIIFDAVGCDKKILNDEKTILSIMLELPALMKMKILSGPNLVRDYDKKNLGITCFEIIDFSHISIHTFIRTKEIYIDIFSCRKFDYGKVRKYLFSKLKLKPSQVETSEVRYPWEK